MTTVKEVLSSARALISDPERWTQGEYAIEDTGLPVPAISPDACAWCADGAIMHALGGDGEHPLWPACTAAMSQAARRLWPDDSDIAVLPYPFVAINDGEAPFITSGEPAEAHANILRVFDAAIEAAPCA